MVRHLESVATYPELRAAFNAVQPKSACSTPGSLLDPGLWRVLKEYADNGRGASTERARAAF